MSTGAGEGKDKPKVGNSMHKGTESKGKTQSACACVYACVCARACVLLLEVAGDKAGKTGDRAMEGVKYEPKKFAEWVRQSTLR